MMMMMMAVCVCLLGHSFQLRGVLGENGGSAFLLQLRHVLCCVWADCAGTDRTNGN